MTIPTFQDFLLPFLKHVADGKEHSIKELFDAMAAHFKLSEEDLKQLLPSGKETRFKNRVYWARVWLAQAKLLDVPGRGRFRISPRGSQLLASNPPRIDDALLQQYPEFVEFRYPSSGAKPKGGKHTADVEVISALSPEEQLETSYEALRAHLSQALLAEVMKADADFFEQLVVDLLVTMGYGGSRADAGQAVGKSGDGGIDGIIKEDRLGLDIVYLQAKRWANPVGSREIRDFAGSLEGHGAQKGVFITTSKFTKDADDFAKRLLQKKIVLIDGAKLTDLMIDYGIGVTDVAKYVVKKLDADYFGVE
jgi:restriction system protein